MIKIKNRKILLLPGDGVGPEVISEVKKIINWFNKKKSLDFKIEEGLVGGASYDKYKNPITDEVFYKALESEAVILGAVGGPKWDNPNAKIRPEQGLLGIRESLGVFANIRPVIIYPSLAKASPLKEEKLIDVDLIVIRELTGGIYFGEKNRTENKASDLCVYHDFEVERIIKIAADLASKRKNQLCSVDKANVLETSRFWRNITDNIITKDYPHIDLEHILVDAAAMYLINRPSDFDVIVTENMFGDILTDEVSMLSGSLGMLPSASLSDNKVGLYEPIHGSAPDIAGKGIANPCGMISSIAMLLRYSLNLEEEAINIENAIYNVIENGARTADIATTDDKISSTEQITKLIIDEIN